MSSIDELFDELNNKSLSPSIRACPLHFTLHFIGIYEIWRKTGWWLRNGKPKAPVRQKGSTSNRRRHGSPGFLDCVYARPGQKADAFRPDLS